MHKQQHKEKNLNDQLPAAFHPHCPRCYSRNLLRLSTKTLIGAGIGASLGGFASWLGFTDTKSLDMNDIPALLSGICTGAIAGAALSNGDDGSLIQEYLCLSCFNRFTWVRGSVN